MAFSRIISATTAAVMLASAVAYLPQTQAFAQEEYSDNSYRDLESGAVVEIASFDDLTYFSEYVNGGGNTDDVTWKLTCDISSGYSYSFDEENNVVNALNSNGEKVFALGTGDGTTMGDVSGNLPEDLPKFTIIGSGDFQFNGTFDGNGYEISGLYGSSAMFGTLDGAKVCNLTVSDSYFYNESGNAASIALTLKGSEISYVTVQDTFVGSDNDGDVGGIAAYAESTVDSNGVQDDNSSIIASQYIGNSIIVNKSASSKHTGGVIGYTYYFGGAQNNIIDNCNITLPIYAYSTSSSGFVGFFASFFFVNHSLYFGEITGNNLSKFQGGSFTDSYTNDTLKPNAGSSFPTYIDDSRVTCGEIAYKLENQRDSSINVYWTQDLANNGTPVLSSSQDLLVRCNGNGFANISADKHLSNDEYTNNEDGTHTYICSNCSCEVTESCAYVNGVCSLCNQVEKPKISTSFGKKYYWINNYSQLCWFAKQVNNGTAETQNVLIEADIIADENVAWVPIGTTSNPYTGVFNGQNHYISGINTGDDLTTYVGLFGYTERATINNLGVIDSNFSGTNYVAAFIGSAVSTTVSNCYAYNNKIKSVNNVYSGFIATAQQTILNFSYTDSDKGILNSGTANIENCFHTMPNSEFGTAVESKDISSGYVAYMLKIQAKKFNIANQWGQDLSLESSYPILNINYEVFCAADKYDNQAPDDHACENITCNNDGSHKYYCSYCKQEVTENCCYVDGFCSICGYFDDSSEYIIYKESGNFTLPTPKDSSVIGWITADGKLYQCGSEIIVEDELKLSRVTLNINTVGASVRLNSGSTGIKFATQLDFEGADLDMLQIKAGTLICPADYVTNDSVLNYQSFVDNDYIALIQDIDDISFAEITVNGIDYDNTYSGSIININAFNYGREFTGCGFVEITYADGNVSYFYASQKSSQSVYSLAAKAYSDRQATSDEVYRYSANSLENVEYFSRYTEDERNVLLGFLDGVVSFDVNLGTTEPTLSIPEVAKDFYSPAYTVSVDYEANTFTVQGNDDWRYYICVTKSNGESVYQRVCILINDKRVTSSNNQDNFEIPESTVESNSTKITENVMTINIVGIGS